MGAQMESGTETFSVQAGNRIELSARTQAEINSRTARLSSEGRIVININTSMPQAFSLGVTIWRNDVVIIWQASLDSPQYQKYLYGKAVALYQSGQYGNAQAVFNKLGDYSDSRAWISRCIDGNKALWEERRKARQEEVEMEKAVGTDKSKTGRGIARYIVGGFLLLFGIGGISDGPSDGFPWPAISIIIGLVCLIWNASQNADYDKKVNEYKRKHRKN